MNEALILDFSNSAQSLCELGKPISFSTGSTSMTYRLTLWHIVNFSSIVCKCRQVPSRLMFLPKRIRKNNHWSNGDRHYELIRPSHGEVKQTTQNCPFLPESSLDD